MAAKGTEKKARQRFPKPLEIVGALEAAKRDCPGEFDFAREVFEAFVDPETLHLEDPVMDEVNRTNAAFTEWFLYDFDVFEGLTLFEMMAQRDPTLKECACTQFYSRFWVIEQDAERGRVILRDIPTCRDYAVRSPHIARMEHWSDGTLGTRIARAHGVWREVGQMALHDNAPASPQPARKGKRRRAERDPAAFIVNIEQVIGHHGVFLENATSTQA